MLIHLHCWLTSNLFVPHIINITSSISDQLAQFLSILMNLVNVTFKNLLVQTWYKKFARENFLLDLLDIGWSSVIKLEREDPNYSLNLYENTLNTY